ncbi:glucosamine-6-phosphate deaminase [Flammeovirga aprica]|uniref:Glucosamine-6-phosphate deaminase n=1 Tax=Flammeovirga aprica JL-4 TaxID=694437 RepID=A0A7X9NZT0_9BACT|nr:glucosamine-6-phosphate deaminase [Flammeovirga aprica]NME66805.1 glucosamine-6-phosphate deaminase [Flammeovirga aprica JL-4]
MNLIADKISEKLDVRVFVDKETASKEAASAIAQLIKTKNSKGEKTVLGLATGSTPLQLYAELIRLHKEEGLSFKNVITFNLDEYYPMSPQSEHSYVHFMKENLFNHIDIEMENVNIPDGTISKEEVNDYCASYEKKISEAGGIDLQLLGIGRTGHIGFNEPDSDWNTLTRIVTLDPLTRKDAAKGFGGIDNVPTEAITMGVGSILKSKKIIMMAWGEGKASIVNEMINGIVTDQVPATYLQLHQNVAVYLDREASTAL